MPTDDDFRAARDRISAARRSGDQDELTAAYQHMRNLTETDKVHTMMRQARIDARNAQQGLR